ncbi:sulfurtransferase TusA family protein [Streptomyces hygroscopicus]|uniref:sulfurtransferase TusA family protein n=1 Tax=Streptomyces hygroscopicus TaxID=1912 RepID=UPI00379B17AB
MTHLSALPGADLTVDGTGLLCVTVLLRLRNRIDGAPPGTVVHVVATDPAAPLDLPAWCHLTGHTYLGPVPGERPVYAHSGSPRAPAAPAGTHRGIRSGRDRRSLRTSERPSRLAAMVAASPGRAAEPGWPWSRIRIGAVERVAAPVALGPVATNKHTPPRRLRPLKKVN